MESEIQQLFRQTSEAFEKSPIKKFAEENEHVWNYCISSTRLILNSTIVIGFNGGAALDEKYEPQTEIPDSTFRDLYNKKDLGSMERVYPYLEKYLGDDNVDEFLQANFCFFRSKNASQITAEDLRLSTPLFESLMRIIKPVRLIGFSSSLRNHLIYSGLLKDIQDGCFNSGKTNVYAYKGKMVSSGRNIPVYLLPHPNSHINGDAREAAWKFCFGNPTVH